MKSFAFVLLLVQAVLIQNAYSQCIRGSSLAVSSPIMTAVAQPNVAASLADTLSLLTVSSLLAETLPLNPNVVAAVPVPVGPACGAAYAPAYAPAIAPACSSVIAPALGYGGCGCGCGYGNMGYNYIF